MLHGRLKKELDRAKAALEEAFMEKAEATLWRRTTAEELARMFDTSSAPKNESAAAEHRRLAEELKQLEADSAHAGDALKKAQQRQLELEAAVRAADAEAARQRARAEATCGRLRQQAEARFREEQQYLRTEYARTFSEIKRLNRMREEAETRYERERTLLDAQISRTRTHLEREARRVQQEWERAKRTAHARVRQVRSQRQSAEERVRQQMESKVAAQRQRLEAEIELALAAQEKAQRALARTEAARRSHQQQVQDLKGRRRRKKKARSEPDNGRDTPSRTASQERDDLEEQAARERAVNAELRLRLQEEKLAWLRQEEQQSESELDKASKYAHAMERMSAKSDSETQGLQLMEDIQAQLGDEQDGRTYAEQRLSLARSAHEQAEAEVERTKRSLQEAREHIARLQERKRRRGKS